MITMSEAAIQETVVSILFVVNISLTEICIYIRLCLLMLVVHKKVVGEGVVDQRGAVAFVFSNALRVLRRLGGMGCKLYDRDAHNGATRLHSFSRSVS